MFRSYSYQFYEMSHAGFAPARAPAAIEPERQDPGAGRDIEVRHERRGLGEGALPVIQGAVPTSASTNRIGSG